MLLVPFQPCACCSAQWSGQVSCSSRRNSEKEEGFTRGSTGVRPSRGGRHVRSTTAGGVMALQHRSELATFEHSVACSLAVLALSWGGAVGPERRLDRPCLKGLEVCSG